MSIETSRPTIEILTGHAELIRRQVEELSKQIQDMPEAGTLRLGALQNAMSAAAQDGLVLGRQLQPLVRVLHRHTTPANTSAEDAVPDMITLNGDPTEHEEVTKELQHVIALLNQPQQMLEKLEQEHKTRESLNAFSMKAVYESMQKTMQGGLQIVNNPEAAGTILAATLPISGAPVEVMNYLGSLAARREQITKLGTDVGNSTPGNPTPYPQPAPSAGVSQGNLNTGNSFRQSTLGFATQMFNAFPRLARIFGGEGANANEAAEKFIDGLMGSMGELLATYMGPNRFLNALLPRDLGESLMFRDIVLKEAQSRTPPVQLTAVEKKKTQDIVTAMRMSPEDQGRLMNCIQQYCRYKREGKPVSTKPTFAQSTEANAKAYLARIESEAKVAATQPNNPNSPNNQIPEVVRNSIGNYFPSGQQERTIANNETDAVELHARDQMKLKFFKTENPLAYKVKINDTRIVTLETGTAASGQNLRELRIKNETQDNRDPANIRIRPDGISGPGMRLTYVMDKLRDNPNATKIRFPADATDASQIVIPS